MRGHHVGLVKLAREGRSDTLSQRGASQQPSEAEGLDHLIVGRAHRKPLAIDAHGTDHKHVGEHHDECLQRIDRRSRVSK